MTSEGLDKQLFHLTRCIISSKGKIKIKQCFDIIIINPSIDPWSKCENTYINYNFQPQHEVKASKIQW